MNEQKQIEAMARLDGRAIYIPIWKQDGRWWTAIEGNVGRIPVPDYPNDHNAVQRVIDGLEVGDTWEEGGKELAMYDSHLTKVINHSTGLRIAQHLATPAQKVEAVLKATGRWEEEG